MPASRVTAAVLALVAASALHAQPAREASAYAPPATPTELGLAGYAKVLCSAVFVSGRDLEEAARNSGFFMLPEGERDGVSWSADRAERLVRVSRGGITRAARFYGDQGCIIQQKDREGIFFEPVAVKSALPEASTQPWPMGDAPSKDPLPPAIDKDRLDAAVAAAFADPEALTAAFLVLYKGRIVAERYMPGITKDTQLESWSMGKSVTATLFGLLVKDGVYSLDQPAPVPEWHEPGDPRSKIKVSDLLRMSSGLRFIAGQDPDYTPDKGYPDHMLIYTGAIDAFRHSISRPLQFPPGTEGRYRNSDPLTIGYLIQQAVRKRGEEYLSFPQRALFDRVGIRRMVLETDPYGNFLLTGYDYGTARNWARLGQLYLQDGVWQGQRLLPEGWSRFVSTPAPAWKRPVYGGLFWINGDGAWKLPRDAYFMAGAGGQRTFVVPSHDLVVVRMGHFRGDRAGMKALNNALAELMAAVKGSAATAPSGDAWPGLWGPSGSGTAPAAARIPGGNGIRGREVWRRPIGSGFSGVSVAGGRAYTAFAESGSDHVAAFDASSGHELWRVRMGETYRGHDGSKDGPASTPALDESRVFVVSRQGLLLALDCATGKEAWRRDLKTELGAAAPYYGFGTSPFVSGAHVIVHAGGEKAGLVALDKSTGALAWSVSHSKASGYSSPVLARLGGRRQILVLANDLVYGVRPEDGGLLWSQPTGWSDEAMRAPLALPDDRVLICGANEARLIELKPDGERFTAREVWKTPRLKNSLSPTVLHEGRLYGFNSGYLVCLDAATADVIWREKVYAGSLILVDGHLLILGAESGELRVGRITGEGYEERLKLPVFNAGAMSVTGPSFAAGRVFVRNLEEMVAVGIVE